MRFQFKKQSFVNFDMVVASNNKIIKTLQTSADGDERANDRAPVVLIVDDDDDSRLMLKILLEMWNYRVVEAGDGIEALDLAENSRPDLILLDVKMPNLDGFAVTEKIRRSAKIGSVPIIFLSGCAEANYKKRAFAVGGNEYLVKPLDFQALENSLSGYLSRSQKL